MTTIGSIGIGLFILIILWIITLIIFVLAVKAQNNIGWIALAISTLITIILTVIPTKQKEDLLEGFVTTEKDYSYIYRNVLLALLILSCVVGSCFFFILHCIEPVRIKPIKPFYVQ